MKGVAETKQNNANGAGSEAVERHYVAPEVSIFELEDSYVLEAEMPGVPKNGIEVTVEGTTLTLVGHRTLEPVAGQPLYRESRAADYRRAFDLDPAIDTSKVAAEMRQGVLVLTLPKAERMKPRKIAIQ